MECPTCGTDNWDFTSNNNARCVNGHHFTVNEDEIEDRSCGEHAPLSGVDAGTYDETRFGETGEITR